MAFDNAGQKVDRCGYALRPYQRPICITTFRYAEDLSPCLWPSWRGRALRSQTAYLPPSPMRDYESKALLEVRKAGGVVKIQVLFGQKSP